MNFLSSFFENLRTKRRIKKVTSLGNTKVIQEIEPRRSIPEHCEFKRCRNNNYLHQCKYCKKYHCDIHILPEDHECPDPKSPYHKFTGKLIL